MERFYIPYIDNRPALININGHKVLVLATDEETLEASEKLSFKEVKSLDGDFQDNDFSGIIDYLPHELTVENRKQHICVVLANHDIDIDTLLITVERELPWVH